MVFNAPTDARNVIWIILLSLIPVSCTGEVTAADCRRVQEEVIALTQESIVPLVESEKPPQVERSVVERIKCLRERVTSCALSDIPDDAPVWNDEKFLRLDARLGFFEVTLEQAAEDENPEMTRILVNSPSFREAVQELQQTVALEGQ